ncbi:MAG: type II toxin-antitoxin system PemK/MazF family toxin, partial [Candidatus Binatia bacterium]
MTPTGTSPSPPVSPGGTLATDPKRSRVFVIVSRQALIDSRLSTVVCAPVFTRREGLATEVPVGTDEGLKHESSILCDALVSLPKSALNDFVGTLSDRPLKALISFVKDVALAAVARPKTIDVHRARQNEWTRSRVRDGRPPAPVLRRRRREARGRRAADAREADAR